MIQNRLFANDAHDAIHHAPAEDADHDGSIIRNQGVVAGVTIARQDFG